MSDKKLFCRFPSRLEIIGIIGALERLVIRHPQGILAFHLCVVLLLSAARIWIVFTPRGTQCPTAPVQQIQVSSPVVPQDGFPSSTAMVRPPIEGEPGFVQCHCAEKKAATQQESTPKARELELVPTAPIPSARECIVCFCARGDASGSSPRETLWPNPASAPRTPPPQSYLVSN